MKKFLCLLLVSSPAFAQLVTHNEDITNADITVVSAEDAKPDRKINHRKSHWITNFNFEGTKYEVPFKFQDGIRQKINTKNHELWGGRLGVGRQIHLGGRMHTTTKTSAFFLGTVYQKVLNGGPDTPEAEAAYTKRSGGMYGVDATQALGMMFDFKTKNPFLGDVSYMVFEPYVEGGIGIGQAYQRINYHYDTGPAAGSTNGVQEDYRQTINDQLTYAKFGGGFNIVAESGFYFFMNATVNNFNISKRKSRTFTKLDDQTGSSSRDTDSNVTMSSVVYALGGGYKF